MKRILARPSFWLILLPAVFLPVSPFFGRSVNPFPLPNWWVQLGVRDLKGDFLRPVPARAIVVIFLGQECPVSNAAIPLLNRLKGEFAPEHVDFIGAYVDPTADLKTLRTHAADYQVAFDTADDRAHRLVELAGATYTPEVAVFSYEGSRLYLGRIDDRVGGPAAARPTAAHNDLREVLLAIVAGKPGPFPGKPGYGCDIPQAVKP